MERIVGERYETTDYGQFHYQVGNRDADLQARKKKLIPSLQQYGQLHDIEVNGNYEIIDGQARFEALKELGLPVRYVISYGRTIEHTIAENSTATPWKMKDYMESYRKRGYADYDRFLAIVEAHKTVPLAAIINIASGTYGGGGRSSAKTSNVKEGKLVFTEEQAAETEAVLGFVEQMLAVSCGNGSKVIFCQGCAFIYQVAAVDNARMLAKWEKFHALKNVGGKAFRSMMEFMGVMQAVYNYRTTPQSAAYIATEYEQHCRQASSYYQARWKAGRK